MKLAKHVATRALLLVVALISSLVASSGAASATSVYDGSYQSTASVRSWWSYSGCDPVDVTYDWSSYVLDSAKWPPNTDWSAIRASLSSALNDGSNGAWGVTQFHTAIADFVEVYWTEDSSAYLEWSGDGVDVTTATSGGNIHVVDIACSQKFYGTGGATPVGISAIPTHTQRISTSTTWSSFYTQRSLFVHGFDLNEPSGYEGEPILTEQLGTKYVAMGDSYSSGEGTFNYDSSSSGCHRSFDSYVGYVANHAHLPNLIFAACSGAQTDDFYVANPAHTGEPAQISRLSAARPDVVTMTIGGDDAMFSDVLAACAEDPNHSGWGCSTDSTLNTDINDRFAALAGNGSAQTNGRTVHSLLQVYRDVHDAAPNAAIYVGGYPKLFGSDENYYTASNSAPGGALCAAPAAVTFSYDDAQWMNNKATELNGIISDAVSAAQSEGINITFVPAGLFGGHSHCDIADSWMNDVVFDGNVPLPGILPESFHPTAEGYQNGYGVAFVSLMN